MCGIIAAFDSKGGDVAKWARAQLQEQLHRGRNGFGLLTFGNGPVAVERSVELTGVLVPLFVSETSGVLLHHRAPTSSENRVSQTHPIPVTGSAELGGDWLVAHNGTIRNRLEVKEEHERMGFRYVTETPDAKGPGYRDGFNDSECAAVDLALAAEMFLDGRNERGTEYALRTEGSQALVGVRVDRKSRKATHLAWCRNDGSPLNRHSGAGTSVFVSSEGIGEEVETDTLFILDLRTMKTRREPLEVPEGWAAPAKPAKRGRKCTRCGSVTYQDSGICLSCRSKESRGTERPKECSTVGCRTLTSDESGTCLACRNRFKEADREGRHPDGKWCSMPSCPWQAAPGDPDGLCHECRKWADSAKGTDGARPVQGFLPEPGPDDRFIGDAELADSILTEMFEALAALQKGLTLRLNGESDRTTDELLSEYSDLNAKGLDELEERFGEASGGPPAERAAPAGGKEAA